MVFMPNLPPRAKYPLAAEAPIIAALEERSTWINVTPTAIATTVLSALADAGWHLMGHGISECHDPERCAQHAAPSTT